MGAYATKVRHIFRRGRLLQILTLRRPKAQPSASKMPKSTTMEAPATVSTAKQPLPGNPLLCFLCDEYFVDPCLLQCYHTFCKRCVATRVFEGRLQCPLCGQNTIVKETVASLPNDNLMRELIDLANSENPPCANCDRRDRNNMYYCTTCGQALCHQCRDNTHRAKMFSTHEVVHMSKCATEPRRCPAHGEHYIMFCAPQRSMLCVNCFRDAPADQRTHCVDIDTAYSQSRKRLEEAQSGIIELQTCVRESVLMFKSLLEELTANMEEEKQIINTFCNGMQESIEKTHAAMAMEVQRQFETKQRLFLGQLSSVSTVMPILQLHLMLSVNFSATANKFQFLELVYAMFDRLATVARLGNVQRPKQTSAVRTNYRSEFAQCLEPWIGKTIIEPCSDYETKPTPSTTTGPTVSVGKQLKASALENDGPFSNHCQHFNTALKEFSQQLFEVKEQINALHRDISILRRTHTPPLGVRYDCIARDCALLDQSLEKHQADLEKTRLIFDGLWEEQMCRIQAEKEIFHDQITEILSLRNEVKQLSGAAQKLEPYVKSFTAEEIQANQSAAVTKETTQQHIKNLIEHIELMDLDGFLISDCKLHPAISLSNMGRSRLCSAGTSVDSMSDTNPYTENKRSVISQIIQKVKTKEDRRKSPSNADDRTSGEQEAGKSNTEPTKVSGKSGDEVSCRSSLSTVIDRYDNAEIDKADDAKTCYSRGGTSEDIKSTLDKVHAAVRSKIDLSGISKEILSKKCISTSSSRTNLAQHKSQSVCGKFPKQSAEVPCMSVKHKESKKIHKSCEKLSDKKLVKAEIIAHRDPDYDRAVKECAQLIARATTPSTIRKQKDAFLKKDRKALSDSLLRTLNFETTADGTTIVKAETHEPEKRKKESDYQRISDATTSRRSASISTPSTSKKHCSPSPATSKAKRKVYPYSDSEDVKCYSGKGDSNESLSTESINSIRPMDAPENTLFLVIGTRKSSKNSLATLQKQRSWETFPPKRRTCKNRNGNVKPRSHHYIKTKDLKEAQKITPESHGHGYTSEEASDKRLCFNAHYKDSLHLKDSFDGSINLRKTDSFEGHEEAVRSLLAAVHETRSQNVARKQRNT